jgi:argininosuccinate synthase
VKTLNAGNKINKTVLLYSGGLDTSVCIKLIGEKYGSEVIALTVDTGGFTKEKLKEIKEKALAAGAKKHIVVDKKDDVFRLISLAIKANAMYEGKYPLCTPVERIPICYAAVEVAEKEGADAIAHGSSGLGNEQIRFDVTLKALAPHLTVYSPIRDFNLRRDWELEYAIKNDIPIDKEHKKYTINEGMWGRTLAGSEFDDPWNLPPEEAYVWTVSPEKAPDKPEIVEIEFEKGVPVAINGEKMDGVKLVQTMNELAGKHGVGRIDMIENHVVGIKERCSYEAPAAVTLIEAHKDLESLVLTKRQQDFKWNFVDPMWTLLMYQGLWVDPLRADLEKMIESSQEMVTGSVKVKLYKGSAKPLARKSPYSLFVKEFISYETGIAKWDQTKTPAFIELWGLQSRMAFQNISR